MLKKKKRSDQSQILDCLKTGFNYAFTHLINEYATWSKHGANVHGLARTNYKPCNICDDDALILDRALSRLKTDNYMSYATIRLYYIQKIKKQKDRQQALASAFLKSGNGQMAKRSKYITRELFFKLLDMSERKLFEYVALDYLSCDPAITEGTKIKIQENIKAL